ncbi:MAG TPA: hypothetical protein VFG54_21985 [Prolixibacteraceae bacterium]|nr:hypothetical protein [Prolixibacteraceae bacterium]
MENTSPELAASLVETVNNNYVDIYYGSMTPAAIADGVIEVLKSKQVLPAVDFTRWVDSNNGYRQVTLPDHSKWIVRRSNEVDRYIHIHPSRSGACTIRFKGSSLKTVYLLKVNGVNSLEAISLKLVNRVRAQAGLSPVKDLDRSSGILHCFETFFSREL